MGTPANKALLDTTGFWHDDLITPRRTIFAWQFVAKRRMQGIAQAIMQQLEEALKRLAQQQPGVDAGALLGRCLSEITRRQSGADFSGW